MAAFWTSDDFDAHEQVELVHDRTSGLTAIVAVHSTHLGPAAGGTRFWHYPDPAGAMRDALRLSRGMSYKNAMAGLPMGGGKAVILADENKTKTPELLAAFADAVEGLGGKYVTAEDVGISEADMAAVAERTQYVSGLPMGGGKAVVLLDNAGTKTPEMLAAFGKAVDELGGRYVTAEDVGASEADMVAISHQTPHVCGLPAEKGTAGGDPGPFTAHGIYLGIRAAVNQALGTDDMAGVRVALQGCGSVGGGVARLLAKDGAVLIVSDIDMDRAAALAEEVGGSSVAPDAIMATDCEVFSPNALGAILDERSIAALACRVVAGGANNQLARPENGVQLHERGILYAPDYVINAGGIINVSLEYLGRRAGTPYSTDDVMARIAAIPDRLREIWAASAESGEGAHIVADRIAQALIGRG